MINPSGSKYSRLEQNSMVPKMFEPLRFDLYKKGNQVTIFLISPWKHTWWELIRILMSTHNISFCEKYKNSNSLEPIYIDCVGV